MCPKDAKISLLSISFCYALSLSLSVFVCCLCNTRAVHPRFAWFLLCCSWVQKLINLFQPSLLFSRGQFFSGFKWFLNGSKKVTLPVTSWTKSRTNLGQFLLRLALITGYFRFFFFFFKGFYSMVYSIFICTVLPFFSASCSFLSWRQTQLPQCVCRQLGHCSGCRLQQIHYSVEREEGLSKQVPETFKQYERF